MKSILTVSAGIIFTEGGNYKEKASALINTEFRRTQQHKLKWLILQRVSSEPQRVTEKHIQALCSPINQATVLGGMLSAHPFLARAGAVVSQSVSGSLRNTHGWIHINERHGKNMRNLVSWSGDGHLCRSRRPPGCQAMIWHFPVGEDGLIRFPATIKSPFK